MEASFLVHMNASLNALATVLLVVALVQIKRKNIGAHKATMIAAFLVSCVFLVFYVTDKAIKRGVHTPFNGEGAVRVLYYGMLISHIALAVLVPVFAIWLIRLGLKRQDARHRKIARIGYPVWMYVSVTGVLIYLMLYWFNPPVVV